MQVQQPPMTPARSSAAPPLDWPHYGIGFIGAIKRGFAKYATFSGRASRSEYWWWNLFVTPILICWSIVVQIGMYYVAFTAALGSDSDELLSTVGIPTLGPVFKLFAFVTTVCVLAIVVPSWAVTVRRLHDSGHSGWTALLSLIPLVGSVILLVFVCSATAPTAHLYGPPGPGATPYGPSGGDPNRGVTAPGQVSRSQFYSDNAHSNGSAQPSSIGDTVAVGSTYYSNNPAYSAQGSGYPGNPGYSAVTAGSQTPRQSNKAKIAIIAITAVVVTVLFSAAIGLYVGLRDDEESASSNTQTQTESGSEADQSQADQTDGTDTTSPTDQYGPGSGIGGDPDDQGTPDSGPESTSPPQLVGQKPFGTKACPSAYDLDATPARSAVNSETTSCDFGEAVRRAYVESGAGGEDVVLPDVYSPFTHKYYKMTCTGAPTVRCTGGVKAEVFLY